MKKEKLHKTIFVGDNASNERITKLVNTKRQKTIIFMYVRNYIIVV